MNEVDQPEATAGRLLELSEEVSRIAGSLTQVSIGLRASVQGLYPSSDSGEPHVLLKRVKGLISERQKRARYIAPELLGEPAWDILLNLLRAELAFERISVLTACSAADVALGTGRRWLNALEFHGLVLQRDEGDPSGNFVVLSADASAALRRYFIEVAGKLER